VLAAGVIRQAGEEAADATNRDAQAERNCKQIAGAARHTERPLDDFCADPSPE